MMQTMPQQPPQGGFFSHKESLADVNAPQMDPQLKEAFTRVVMAGLKIMYAPQTREILMNSLGQQQGVSDIVASNIAGLMKIIDDKSGHKMPKQVIIPAGVALMQDLFKFMAETGIAQPTEDDATQSLQKLVVMLAQAYHPMQSQQSQQDGVIQQPQQPQTAGLIGA